MSQTIKPSIGSRLSEFLTGTCPFSGSCIDYMPTEGVCTDKKIRESYHLEEDTPRCYKSKTSARQEIKEIQEIRER